MERGSRQAAAGHSHSGLLAYQHGLDINYGLDLDTQFLEEHEAIHEFQIEHHLNHDQAEKQP